MEDDFKDNDPVIDKEKLEEQYAEMTPMMITEFELKTFDDKMNKLLEGMKDIDWSKAMVAAHTLKGSSGYIFATRFHKKAKIFQEFIKSDCEKIDPQPEDMYKGYRVLPSFDQKKQIQAFEYFFPFLKEAKALKKEMSTYSNSNVPQDIYSKEEKAIQDVFKKYKSDFNGTALAQQKSIQSKKQSEAIKSEKRIDTLKSEQNQDNNVVDQPRNDACCSKCQIF